MTPIELALAGGFAYLMANRATAETEIQFLERAEGIDGRLQAFLASWQQSGPFPILLAPDGGLRTDAAKQLKYYTQGYSNARTLRETAHGRGGAMDIWPVGFDPRISITQSSPMELNCKDRFYVIGAAAEEFGLVWGGRWNSPYDLPHIQVPNWQQLPYPPVR